MTESITLYYAFLGLLGAFTYVIIRARSVWDLVSFKSMRRYLIGLIAGYIYSILYSEYSFPDTIMSFIVGYFGQDFIEALVERYQFEKTRRRGRG